MSAEYHSAEGEPDFAFGNAAENALLRRYVTAQLRANGPISFRRFMQFVLYDPDEGYYSRRDPIGARGDYLTSPELHPLFGALLCRQLAELWRALERPAVFTVAEVGAGSGALARAILAAADSEFGAALRYAIVEPHRRLRDMQVRTLGSLAQAVTWHETLTSLAPIAAGCLLSNELIDSFPVHRVMVRNGRLRELLVGLAGDEFIDVEGDPSTPALAEYFVRIGLLPGEGCAAEVNLDAPAWLREAAAALERGFMLTLDYGYPARQLYAGWRRKGTLLCYYQHTAHTNPYVRLGHQDLTAHVDFTSLARAGEEAGLQTLGFTSQQRFLASLGIEEALAGGPGGAVPLEEFLARRRAVGDLLNPEGLGRVRVLLQGKDVGTPRLRGFAHGNEVETLWMR
ncbi:MAG TPA: SAM-dependent methyltransferase [Dehalococcoidia bacterium]|nr:SAM-dependent methyltransferase [Dehalococcoidia bacterium]